MAGDLGRSQPAHGAPIIEDLVARMRDGDREAAATFVTLYEDRIRRRVRGKLGPSARRIFDSQDIHSTIGRRLDDFVKAGRLEAACAEQLWALVGKIAKNAVVDKLRVIKQLELMENPSGPFVSDAVDRSREARRRREGEGIDLDLLLDMITDPLERSILTMRAHGTSHADIARSLDVSATQVRQRWSGMRRRFRARLEASLLT